MKYIFGPVVSRRFGLSLGIDLSPDKKRCNFDCIYCELDPSTPLVEYINPPNVEDILKDVKDATKRFEFEVLTVTSNGEPTLYPYLDKLVKELKKINKKLLILSNGSTIYNPLIQEALKKFDIVKLSLDSVIERTFKKIDRPHKSIELKKIIEGLKEFRKIYNGEMVIEIMVVKGINDKKEEFIKLNEVLKEIKPDRVDISTIDRPPAYNVNGVTPEKLYELSHYIKNQNIFIPTRESIKILLDFEREDILNTLKKRPFTQKDIELFNEKSLRIFNDLLKENLIEEVWVGGVKFYKAFV